MLLCRNKENTNTFWLKKKTSVTMSFIHNCVEAKKIIQRPMETNFFSFFFFAAHTGRVNSVLLSQGNYLFYTK